ncbi:hypothetical protein ACTXT7_000184 [Hymenolepis weldensis]
MKTEAHVDFYEEKFEFINTADSSDSRMERQDHANHEINLDNCAYVISNYYKFKRRQLLCLESGSKMISARIDFRDRLSAKKLGDCNG